MASFLGRGFNSRRLHQKFSQMQARYFVSLNKTSEGFSVWAPGLPGCASQGRSEKEALENIRDAIREYLEVAEELAASDEKREVVVDR